jgi:TfoX/Sxy family transcriptional regulator of competence genes
MEDTLDRVRALLPTSEEKRMFGGVGFMVDGAMVCAVSPRGVMVRVDRDEQDELVEQDGVERMVMGQRTSRTWVSLTHELLADDTELGTWMERGSAATRAASG